MDAHWLTAPPAEVAAAMATQRRTARPPWLPTCRRMLVHVTWSLLLWYCFIAFMAIGIRVDGYGDNDTGPDDWRDLAIAVLVLLLGMAGALLLQRWSRRPPSPRARLAEWRQTLTALANGFEPQPRSGSPLPTLIAQPAGRASAYPRFTALGGAGVEFGNLVFRTGLHGKPVTRGYLAVRLPSALPHLYLDSLANGRSPGDLPTSVDRQQRLSLEGDFDRHFAAYAPTTYGTDALYALTPDVMAALIDDASAFDVEIIDDRVIFSTPSAADYSDAATWARIETILSGVALRIAKRAAAYRDDRVPRQYTRPARIIGPDGRRLSNAYRSRGLWPLLGRVGWVFTLVLLYAVPGIFAFAGFMSIIDDK
ncbi:hypothetical protein ACEXQB_006715 [Herbiconiux sp. P18]|uniref:hypothetical protein n=1 Tax=Herbiconiux liangxiaofengii TaxID=3342795 RepID=UPI0035BB7F25